jgi:hypothetical protein
MPVDLTKAQAQARAVVAVFNYEVPLRPTIARANQNVAMAASLLDTLPTPSTHRRGGQGVPSTEGHLSRSC